MKFKNKVFQPSTLHVLMVSFLLGGVGALLIGLQQSLSTAEESIRPALKVAVFIQPTIADTDAEKWAAGLMALDSEIASTEYIPRQNALQKAQENSTLSKSLLLLHENPFPNSVIVHYKDLAWLDRPEPTMLIKSQPEVGEIRWNPEARSVFRSLDQWRMWLVRLAAFAMVLLMSWCLIGLYRFYELKAPLGELLFQIGIGLMGGGLAVATWSVALRKVGADAALYRPESISLWPLLTAVIASMAVFGWKVEREN